jgi:hypothetical protein
MSRLLAETESYADGIVVDTLHAHLRKLRPNFMSDKIRLTAISSPIGVQHAHHSQIKIQAIPSTNCHTIELPPPLAPRVSLLLQNWRKFFKECGPTCSHIWKNWPTATAEGFGAVFFKPPVCDVGRARVVQIYELVCLREVSASLQEQATNFKV